MPADARPAAHLDPVLIALVALGGAVGTALRHGVSTVLPQAPGFPTATFLVNIVGAFLLGVLLEALVRRGPETRRGQRLRLGLGTGLLGGLTTFSALALEVERLLALGDTGTASLYAASSLVVGFLACLLGVALAAGQHRWLLPDDPDARADHR